MEPTVQTRESAWLVIGRAVLVGMAITLVGTLPRNLLYAANLDYHAEIPWAVPAVGVYLGFFWWYLNGGGTDGATAAARREQLRAYRVPPKVWAWALAAGVAGIVALVFGLQLANRWVELPVQSLPDLSRVPPGTVLSLLLAAAPVAGVIEEAAFRGYMQGPIERRCGLPVAILITGTMFAVAHLDFTPVLWPYYVAVAALYGTVTHLAGSILPAVVLHTGGNLYSNFDLWAHGRAEWQAGTGSSAAAGWPALGLGFALAAAVTAGCFILLARVTAERRRTQATLSAGGCLVR